jgi:alkyl hydroperoxide reductase subunit AhpF
MAFISDRDREHIKEHFDLSLVSDVEILMFTQRESLIIVPGRPSCETCGPTRELLEEVSALSDKISLKVYEVESSPDETEAYGIDYVPAFILKGAARGQVRFFGIPSGYEFPAFIDDLVDASTGSTDLSQETRDYLMLIIDNLNLKVFTTPN